MKSNFALRVAVAGCFSLAAGSALATVTLGTGSTATRVAKEIPSTTTTLTNTGNFLAIAIAAPGGAAGTGTNPVYLKLALTNGAKFATAPIVTCSGLTGANGTTAVTAAQSVIQNGGAGFSTVTFVMTGDSLSADYIFTSTAVCTVSGFNLTISGLNNVDVSATYEYTNGLQQASANTLGSFVTFVDSFSASYSASTGTAIVDATSGSDNFVTGSNNTGGTAVLGFLRFDRNASSANTATMGDDITNVGAAIGAGSGAVTISGPSLEAMKASKGTSGVYLSSAAGCGATVVAATFASSAANSVTFTGLTTANMSGGVYVCGAVSSTNTNVILTGQITGQFAGTQLANVTVNFGSAGNLQNVAQNGKTKNAFLVNASSSAAKTSVLRLVNTGGNTGTIRATAYLIGDGVTAGVPNADGTQVGTANATIATLTANQSVSMTSAQLEALLGYTPAGGTVKYRVVFSAGLADFKVLNYTRDVATGAIVLSQNQDD